MSNSAGQGRTQTPRGFLARLAHDRAGNTIALVGAAMFPLLAMIGGGIDMGRSYLSQSRLQQACDAGVLAARKKIGATSLAVMTLPADANALGHKFFDVNFQDGSYGTESRTFTMTLEDDYSVSGRATVDVPTTIMQLFSYDDVPLEVNCTAQLNMANTDIMFVLDTTGSMNQINPGDTESKIQALRRVVKSFYASVEAGKAPGTRIRYGFLPYSTNVNVGRLLKSDWMVDNWTYQLREQHDTGATELGPVFDEKWTYVSGDEDPGSTTIATSCPDGSAADPVQVNYWVDGSGQENWEYVRNGTSYSCSYSDGGTLLVTPTVWTNYRYIYSYLNKGNRTVPVYDWEYKPMTLDVTDFKDSDGDRPPKLGSLQVDMGGSPRNPDKMDGWFRGCIEERDTYEIDDYDNVDLTRALDLDLDTVPTTGDPSTQWRPVINEFSWVRALPWYGGGSITPGTTYFNQDYVNSGWWGLSACPAEAVKLDDYDASFVANYVDSLVPRGSTYHDIGMIWGGRMISPNGLFAAENADLSGKPTSRHIIFLTDGLTAPYDLSYGTYGIEPINQRRWSPSSSLTLTQTVEKRFNFTCEQVKKKNITIWVISFGVSMNSILEACASDNDHALQADTADQLSEAFDKIAKSLGDLRLTK